MAVHVNKGGQSPKKGRKGRRSKNQLVVHKLNVMSPNRSRQTISEVRSAHKVAEFIHNPNRVALYDMFEDAMVDPFLTGIIKKRMHMVRNKGLRLVDKQGKHLEQFDDLIAGKQFRRLRKYIFNTILYGLTGVEFLPGRELRYNLIPRKHIKPHIGKIVYDQYGTEGEDYTNMANIWILQSDEEDNNFGLLLKALPYVLFKRHGFVNWSEFVEIYGQPTRVGKYDAYDNGTRELLEQALEKAGRSLSIMIPKQANLDFVDGKTTNSDGKLQNGFKDACDEQLAVLFLGVTGTTKSSGADGYAQSKTHSEQQMEITQDDMDYEIETLNDPDFFAVLNSYGYNIPEGAKFEHEEEADLAWLAQKLKVDSVVSSKVPVPADYWYDTYKITKPKDEEETEQPPKPTEKKEGDDEEEDINENPPSDAPAKKEKEKPKPPKKKSLTAMLKKAVASIFSHQPRRDGAFD